MKPLSTKLLAPGFTLIEILIALAVFAVLATMTSSALYYAFQTRERLTEQSKRLDELEFAIILIQRDISQIIYRPIRGDNLKLLPAFIGEPNYTEFTRAGLTNPYSIHKRSTLRRIALLCKNNTLIRRSWDRIDLVKKEQFVEKVLLTGVQACQFTYLNSKNQFLNSWQNPEHPGAISAKGPPPLPKGIQAAITLQDWGEMSLLFGTFEALYAPS